MGEHSKADLTLQLLGVDPNVIIAIHQMSDAEKNQPEWLWYDNEHMGLSLGRWSRVANGAPYIRADIVLAAIAKAEGSSK